jgi:hypothetical protein
MEYIEKEIIVKNYSNMVLLTKKSFPSEYFYLNNDFRISPDMILMYKNIRENK